MVVVIGGHTRNIGKTSVVCGVIRALPDWNWTAIKIKQYGHGKCSRDGGPCACADPEHSIAISEENGASASSPASPSSDSGRFLAAGAARAFWIRTLADELNEAMPEIHRIIAASGNTIIESNSVLQFLKPDIYAMVLNGSLPDFKASSLRLLDRANVLVATSDAPLAWPEVPPALLRNKPKFIAPPPSYQSAEFIDFIQSKIAVRSRS
jgi:hypothetical protein